MAALGKYAPYDRTLDQFSLVGREVMTAFRASTVVAGEIASRVANFGIGAVGTTFGPTSVHVAPGDAVRIVKGSWCQCRAVLSAPTVTTLRCESLTMALDNGANQHLRVWPGNYSGDALSLNGQFLSVTDDEMLFGNDFLPLNSDGRLLFRCYADVLNSGAVDETINLFGVLMLERWRLSTSSRMRG